MREDNPFYLNFGLKPENYIDRLMQSKEICSTFESENNNQNVYMISGVRGSGKTVLMSHISTYFNQKDDWIVVELLSKVDMLEQLASNLYDADKMKLVFAKKSFDFSFYGMSFRIEGEKPISNIVSLLEKMFDHIVQAKKKVLICVDEVVKNDYVETFCQAFQLLLRKNYPIYLLMTGLYQNIYDLQNEKSLTFLYRAPKLYIEPLNQLAISNSYKKIFDIDEDTANSLAKMTKGYAYAYQLLGYLLWEQGDTSINDELLSKFDQYLYEYVYEKIWIELSTNDKKFMLAFKESEKLNFSEILQITNLDKKSASVYRDRLIKKGILSAPEYGKLVILLPRFKEFIKKISFFEE